MTAGKTDFRQGVLVQFHGKDASSCVIKTSAVNLRCCLGMKSSKKRLKTSEKQVHNITVVDLDVSGL